MVLTLGYIREKWQHEGFQKYLRNTGWMFLGRVFTLGVSFFVGAYIARYLGPSNYGLMNYAISFVGIFGFLASFGIDGIVSREIIKRDEDKDKLIGTAFFIKITGSILTIISVILIAALTTNDKFTLLLISLFSLSYIPQSFNIIETYFQSLVLSKNVVRAQIFATIISTTLKLCVVWLNKGIFWILFIYVVEASIIAIFLLISFKYLGNHFKSWKFDRVAAHNLLKDSWPLMISSLAISLYMKIDQVMIKNMLGDDQAGLYSVVVKLSEIWYFIPIMITSSVFPAIVKSMQAGLDIFERRIKKLYSFMFWTSSILSAATFLFGGVIIKIFFGIDYIGSILPLQIYIWSSISVFIGVVIGNYLLVENLNHIALFNTILGAIINITLNLMLIPKYGISGAAIATVVSYTLAMCSLFIFRKTRKHGFLIINSVLNIK